MEPDFLASEPQPVTVIETHSPAAAKPAAPANDGACELCARVIPAGTSGMVSSMRNNALTQKKVCADCATQVRRELEAEAQSRGLLRPAVAGLIGALIGAAIWTAIAVATDHEIGYIAVLVGFLTGRGVKLGAGPSRSQSLQTLAAVLSVVGLFAAKYFMVAYAAADAAGLSPLDGRIASAFFEHFTELLSPFDILWIVLAVGAAYRVAAPSVVHVEGGR